MPCASCSCGLSSVAKKALMALTGLVLVGFILGHVSGNLLYFKGPEALDAYAKWLHDLGPMLWVARIVLLVSVAIHIWVGISLAIDNRAARAGGPQVDATRKATLGSRTMPYTGFVVLGFIVFHLLHFTLRKVALAPEVVDLADKGGVHQMLVAGFASIPVSLFYIVAMALLCLHLSHGVSSMFQTLGLRNERWRTPLDRMAVAYGWVIFLGFASIPVHVLATR
jgi:succinate dehydrogenase / fumarate reductase cytochrome b subunit